MITGQLVSPHQPHTGLSRLTSWMLNCWIHGIAKIKKIIVPLLTVGKNHLDLDLHISDSINVVMIYPSR